MTATEARLLKTKTDPAFYFGSWTRRRRLLVVGILLLGGLAVQTFLVGFLGTLLLVFGVALAVPRGVFNSPESERGKSEWKNVTAEQFRELFALEAESTRWAVCNLDINCVRGFLFFLGTAAAGGAAVLVLTLLQGGWSWQKALLEPMPGLRAELLAVDAVVLWVPVWIFGQRWSWKPADLLTKVRALHTILSRARQVPDPEADVSPMLEVRTVPGGTLPVDARLFVTRKDAPSEFIGVQVQVSLNKVQNVSYPYLYAVVIAREEFGLSAEDFWFSKDVVEFEDADDEVDVLVIRQKTSKTSGYHTKEPDQIRIFEEAMDVARRAIERFEEEGEEEEVTRDT
jgi:hypothetical protein